MDPGLVAEVLAWYEREEDWAVVRAHEECVGEGHARGRARAERWSRL